MCQRIHAFWLLWGVGLGVEVQEALFPLYSISVQCVKDTLELYNTMSSECRNKAFENFLEK